MFDGALDLNKMSCINTYCAQTQIPICAFLRMCKNIILIHIENIIMRTNIVIDDQLMNDALQATGLKTKKEAVELGLKTLIKLKQQADIKGLKGKLRWDGDLDTMRTTL
jgi:Arc/MetJ family transcription regulator